MSSSQIAPHVYVHRTRADWGRGIVVEQLPDRTRFVFENAGERTFMNGVSWLNEVELPATERAALAKSLLHRYSHRSSTPRKKTAAKAKAAAAMTFDRQQAIFTARFASGFADAKYLAEERVDSLIALAQELLSAERLDAAIARGAADEIFADAVKVLHETARLSFPKADRPAFEKMPPGGHALFATSLRALLYGDAPYATRFDAFVRSLGMKTAPWTIATVFAAAVHPEAHMLVKPTVNQRQARALGTEDPPVGEPTGSGYAQHLRVAEALREKLRAAGQVPRDLFDVYAYEWRSLSKSATPRIAAELS